jgi:hypothetical protein
MMMALASAHAPMIDIMINPGNQKKTTNHTRDAKHLSSAGFKFVGSHVPIVINNTTPKHIVTSHFPRAWKGILRNDRIVHSRPKTICI